MGVSPVLIGVAMSLPRFWEMIIDPWIGSLSDRTHTPLGRRHPFILTGGTCSMISWVSRQLGQPQTMMLFLCLSLAGKLSLWWTMRPENVIKPLSILMLTME